MSDLRRCQNCAAPLIVHRGDAKFCGTNCRNEFGNKRRRSERSTAKRLAPVEGGVGTRGGNVRSVDEARQLQTASKALDRWRLVMELQIHRALLETDHFHIDDLDCLNLPAEAFRVRGTLVSSVKRTGVMRSTGVYRKVSHKAANGRPAPIYEITEKGRAELQTLVGSSSDVPAGASLVAAAPSQDPSTPVQLNGGSSGEVGAAVQLGEERKDIAGPTAAAGERGRSPWSGRSGLPGDGQDGAGSPPNNDKLGASPPVGADAGSVSSPDNSRQGGSSDELLDAFQDTSAGEGTPQALQGRPITSSVADRGAPGVLQLDGKRKAPSMYDPMEGEAA